MIISLKSELTFDIKTNFRILDKYYFFHNCTSCPAETNYDRRKILKLFIYSIS